MEQPADRDTLATYDVNVDGLTRWRKARGEYLSARAALVGAVERQGWRAPARAPATSFVDIVFDGPPGPDAPHFVEVEDDEGRSIRYGEWVERDDGSWVLRIRLTWAGTDDPLTGHNVSARTAGRWRTSVDPIPPPRYTSS